MTEEKFAWLPIIVDTWRPCETKALIWLQSYSITISKGPFTPLNGVNTVGEKWCRKLGFFSYEF